MSRFLLSLVESYWYSSSYLPGNRFAGLVVKASASGAEDPGFESRLRRVIPVT